MANGDVINIHNMLGILHYCYSSRGEVAFELFLKSIMTTILYSLNIKENDLKYNLKH